MGAPTTAKFQAGASLAFGSVTGTFATFATFNGSIQSITILSTLDNEVAINFDGVTASNQLTIPAAAAATGRQWTISIPFAPTLHYAGAVTIKHTGVAPTAGSISIFATAGA